MRLLLALAMTVVLAATLGPRTASAERLRAAGSRISMDLPKGFMTADRFTGFINETLSASFVVAEMPAEAYAKMVSSLTPEALATRGFRAAKLGRLTRAETHTYVLAEQTEPNTGMVVQKFLLLLSTPDQTILISGNLPKAGAKQLTPQAMEKALVSARIEAAPAPQSDLVAMSYLGSFKPVSTVVGQTRLFARDGAPIGTPEIRNHPIVILAPSLDRQPVPNPEAKAGMALLQTASLTAIDVIETAEVTIDGLKGIALTAKAKDKDSAAPQQVYQVFLPLPAGGFVRFLAITPEAEAAALLPEFKAMAASIQAKR
jgi:hypothetical protein